MGRPFLDIREAVFGRTDRQTGANTRPRGSGGHGPGTGVGSGCFAAGGGRQEQTWDGPAIGQWPEDPLGKADSQSLSKEQRATSIR